MFNDPLVCYQAIATELCEIVKPGWSSINVTAEAFDNSIELIVVSTDKSGKRDSDHDPIMLADYFWELRTLVSTPTKGLYSKCFFSLCDDGKFKVDFQY